MVDNFKFQALLGRRCTATEVQRTCAWDSDKARKPLGQGSLSAWAYVAHAVSEYRQAEAGTVD